jgi:hypothetical protein
MRRPWPALGRSAKENKQPRRSTPIGKINFCFVYKDMTGETAVEKRMNILAESHTMVT